MDELEAECLACKPGTYVLLAHKGIDDLQLYVSIEKHKSVVDPWRGGRCETARPLQIRLTSQDAH